MHIFVSKSLEEQHGKSCEHPSCIGSSVMQYLNEKNDNDMITGVTKEIDYMLARG
jgi:hypothetical protein